MPMSVTRKYLTRGLLTRPHGLGMNTICVILAVRLGNVFRLARVPEINE